MGTVRLAVAFLSLLAGILYSTVFFVPLFSGQIEVSPTEVSIDEIEAGEVPDACWLEVTGGHVVLSEAEATVYGKPSEGTGRLGLMSAPVMSRGLWERWRAGVAEGQPVDLAGLRLAVVMDDEQVSRLWPAIRQQVIAAEEIELIAEPLTLVGETTPNGSFYSKPFRDRYPPLAENIDWEEVVFLRFEKEYCSLVSRLKDLAIGALLVLLAVGIFTYGRRHPARSPGATCNVEALESPGGADGGNAGDDVD